MVICMTLIFCFFASLLGGLSFFLFGMRVMSKSLEELSSSGIQKTLNKATSNDIKGFFYGAGITAILQSSSTVTVMLVGLVNSGVLSFDSTFGIIMGSNVGTTLTAWIISLSGIKESGPILTLISPKTFTPLLSFAGICLIFISRHPKRQMLGQIFVGFSILMYGMELMSGAINVISDLDFFKLLLSNLKSPIFALIVSTLFTGIIQSSAATIGIIESLSLTGSLSYQMAIPMVLGANIGTCITAFISSCGTNKGAKSVVTLHFAVNIIGSVICMIILYLFSANINAKKHITMGDVALIHTLFNIVTSVIFIPFKKPLMKLCGIIAGNKKSGYLQNPSFLI